jgi:long-chain-fatty-acid--CoA ligase ACSBG
MNELSNKGTSFEYTAAYHLFLKRVKKSLGLEKAKFIIFGAAPLQKSTLKFFMSLNIKLMNMYGMTETTGPLSVNFPNKAKIETAGKVIPGTQIMIDSKKKEGEIWFRGRTGFMGYYKDPKASEDTYDSDGFIHTGDTGSIDSDGFITVTGRLKDIIITAGGENVSPLLIEATFKSICKIISNVIVIGEGRKFLSLVVTLPVLEDLNSNLPQSFPSDILQLLQAIQSKAKNIKEAQKCVKIGQYMQKCVEKLNKRAISRAQEIKKWRILGNDFTIEGGELTPTLKLKRNLINKKYKHIINKMYAESNL